MSRRSAANVSVVESGATPVDVPVAVVLAAHVARRIGVGDGPERGGLRVLDGLGVAADRRLHRGRGDHLHEVVDDDVAQRADRVVEVPAIVDAEVLGHRDLHAVDPVPVPDRLQHRVREAQVEDLLEAHLPEVVVDAVELRLVDVLVQLVGERARRLEVVPEGLLDHEPGALGEPRVGEPRDDLAEQERRDLEVEDGVLGAADGLRDAAVRGVVAEVALDVREALREAREDRLVERLAGADDGVAGPRAQAVDRPVVDRDPDDRAAEQAALLEPVQRVERHHAGEVAGDAEDDEHVGVRRGPVTGRRRAGSARRHTGCCGGAHVDLLFSPARPRRGHARASLLARRPA